MTEPMTAHRIMPVLTLLVLVSIGAFAESDFASRPPAPAAAAADKQAGEKPGEQLGRAVEVIDRSTMLGVVVNSCSRNEQKYCYSRYGPAAANGEESSSPAAES